MYIMIVVMYLSKMLKIVEAIYVDLNYLKGNLSKINGY